LEEIADGELEQQGLIVGPAPVERDAPLEAQGPDRREPAEAPTERVEHAEEQVVLLVLEELGVRGVGVAGVVEDHPANSDLLEDGELDLEVEDHLLVAAGAEVLRR